MLDLQTLYLNHLKRSLMDINNRDVPESVIDPVSFEEGTKPAWFEHFWFGNALTMCGTKKLDNVQFCVESCLNDGISGDFVECGVWRGGVCMWMRGILAAHGVTDRTVWVVDSFQGMPKPPEDSIDTRLYNFPQLIKANHWAVDQDTVKANFQRYGLLDKQVQFIPGWFEDTLPAAPIERIAVLRLDGDYYQSTMDILNNLYPRLMPGGYVIVDDWGLDQICGEKQAVIDYRDTHGITDEIVEVDWQSVYWRKG
ncbi:MAG: TylF/MycF/NovP-related O-methyltransferase [Chloroflexota bacterium]